MQHRFKREYVDEVDTFKSLGSLITEDATCNKNIRETLAKGMSTGTELIQIWKKHNIKLTTKLRLVKALVWPVATFGCESWTIKKRDEERIEAFEMGSRTIRRRTIRRGQFVAKYKINFIES